MGRNFGLTRSCHICGARGDEIKLCLAGSSCAKAEGKIADVAVLAAALNWLRNHYEVADSETAKANPMLPEIKARVLKRVDAILQDFEPTGAGAEEMRRRYP